MGKLDPFDCLLRGRGGAEDWNAWRQSGARPPELAGRKLDGIDLSGFDLSEMDLRGSDLKGARLVGTGFEGADLTGADLRRARLEGARFTRARLKHAHLDETTLSWTDFAYADVRNATFEGAQAHTTNWSFANLAGARLPQAAEQTLKRVLDSVQTATTHARAALTVLLGASVYCVLASANTADGDLLSNIGTLALPVVGIDVSVHRFFTLAPVVLIVLFVYFHIYLSHLSQLSLKLPARFPDGARLGERLHPWMLNIVVEERLSFARWGKDSILEHWANARVHSPWVVVQSFAAVLLTWTLAPLTCTWLLWTVRVCSLGPLVWWLYATSIGSWTLAWALFSQERARVLPIREGHPARRALGRCTVLSAIILATGFAFRASGSARLATAVSPDAQPGEPLLHGVERVFRPDLRGAALEGADLRALDLRGIRMDRADLKGGDLRGSDLMGAILWRADLEGAALVSAVLTFAQLSEANLSSVAAARSAFDGAHMQEAQLARAKMISASLTDARLEGVRAEAVVLSSADLSRADLSRARLARADLSGASLVCATLSKAELVEADLRGADLRGADLRGADLRGADISGAKLSSACFETATSPGLECDAGTVWPTAYRPSEIVADDCSLAYAMSDPDRKPEPDCETFCEAAEQARLPDDGTR